MSSNISTEAMPPEMYFVREYRRDMAMAARDRRHMTVMKNPGWTSGRYKIR
jgi:hypothetical protein